MHEGQTGNSHQIDLIVVFSARRGNEPAANPKISVGQASDLPLETVNIARGKLDGRCHVG